MMGVGINLVAGRGAGAWSPGVLGAAAWFRGDVGSVASWTDQSGNGRDAPAGTTAPTTTTVAGRPAFNFAGGGYFVNTTSSLVAAGSIYTVLTVGQASDATGGTLICLRRTTLHSATFFFSTGGVTYVYNDGGPAFASIPDTPTATEVQSPFLAEHAYAGAGNQMACRLNRTARTVGGSGSQGSEDGSTGFFIGTDGVTFLWNGKIAEIAVLARALTAGERTSWEAYVAARYGI